MSLADDARKLREQGMTYDQIAKELDCSKSTLSYHLSDGQKEKSMERTRQLRKSNGASRKAEFFQAPVRPPREIGPEVASPASMGAAKVCNFIVKPTEDCGERFTFKDVVAKHGANPVCYLSGKEIDLTNPRSYEFDHIVPKSKGGTNSIDNLGITSREANRAKHDLSLEEFLALCKNVLEHNGYTVEKE